MPTKGIKYTQTAQSKGFLYHQKETAKTAGMVLNLIFIGDLQKQKQKKTIRINY